MVVRQLARSSSDRMISGVCGGVGRYFELDATLVRVAFVLLALMGGSGLIAYVVLALLMPAEGDEETEPAERARQGLRDMTEGVGDLAAKAKTALAEQRASRGQDGRGMTPQVVLGFALVLIGAMFLFSSVVDLWSLGRFAWPAMIMAAGLLVILRARR